MTFVELRLDPDEKGEGKLASQLSADEGRDVIELRDYSGLGSLPDFRHSVSSKTRAATPTHG
jgi:hypothetical protein